jgi:hypothetical protein
MNLTTTRPAGLKLGRERIRLLSASPALGASARERITVYTCESGHTGCTTSHMQSCVDYTYTCASWEQGCYN